jgi:GMP synthase PP-ATPase subunit
MQELRVVQYFGLSNIIWQAFITTTKDFMTANWARLPNQLLERISVRVTNEVKEVNRVLYDITSKPPGTVEWE